MKISCPYCGQHYEVDESFYGHRIKCSVCGRKSELPAPAPETDDSEEIDPELFEEFQENIDDLIENNALRNTFREKALSKFKELGEDSASDIASWYIVNDPGCLTRKFRDDFSKFEEILKEEFITRFVKFTSSFRKPDNGETMSREWQIKALEDEGCSIGEKVRSWTEGQADAALEYWRLLQNTVTIEKDNFYDYWSESSMAELKESEFLDCPVPEVKKKYVNISKVKTQRFDPLPESDVKQCPFCGETIKAVAVKCRYCGSMLGGSSSVVPSSGGSDLIYRLLCFFFGTIGIHNFYAGENKKGVFKIILLIAGIVAAAPCPPAGLLILGMNSVLVLIELIYGYPKR